MTSQGYRTALGKKLINDKLRKTRGNYIELDKQAAKKLEGARLARIDGTVHLTHIQSFEKCIAALLRIYITIAWRGQAIHESIPYQ